MSEDFDSLEWLAEWDRWLNKVESYWPEPRPQDLYRAWRFALVSAFGTIEQYHTDPEFRAAVHSAEQMLQTIHERARRKS